MISIYLSIYDNFKKTLPLWDSLHKISDETPVLYKINTK